MKFDTIIKTNNLICKFTIIQMESVLNYIEYETYFLNLIALKSYVNMADCFEAVCP